MQIGPFIPGGCILCGFGVHQNRALKAYDCTTKQFGAVCPQYAADYYHCTECKRIVYKYQLSNTGVCTECQEKAQK